jgi:hypothetical protein
VPVHSIESLNTIEINEDHPMNLRDEELLENPNVLPQMRFLFNDETILDLTIQIVFEGIRLASSGNAEKEKMRKTFKTMLSQFMCIENIE